MKSLLQVRKETKEKLGRELQQKEEIFLQWMHEHYVKEQHKGSEKGKGV